MKRWACEKCGHIHPGINPPMICPECKSDQDSFVYRRLRKEDYAKMRQLKKRLPDRADVIVLGTGVSAFTAAIAASYHGASVIMMDTESQLGGGVISGFSDKEKAAAYKSIKEWEESGRDEEDVIVTQYKDKASNMIEFLSEEDLLPEFAERKRDPKGVPHPWQAFAESTMLEDGVKSSPETRRSLLNQLAHWSTDNGVRTLLNHEILELIEDEDMKVTGVKVKFNDKSRVYHADMGIISFLGEENNNLLMGEKGEKRSMDEVSSLYIVTYIPDRKAEKEEEDFWGKDSVIGPAMADAYEAGRRVVIESGLLDTVDGKSEDEKADEEKADEEKTPEE